MSAEIEHIGRALREARETKGLSQRSLSRSSGIPQSHISKIENGGVDITLSSLLALTRALDLEPVLVPRKLIPAVQSMVRSAGSRTLEVPTSEPSVLGQTPNVRAAYTLDDEDDEDG